MKKNFRFYADIKHVVWERNWHTIPAETKEEALQRLINNIDSYEYHDESEILYDTLTPLDLENDPDGAATEEIRDEVDTLLWDNFKGSHVESEVSERSLEYLIGLNTLTFPEWRKGQNVFNSVHSLYPDIANELRGGDTDCFYNDNKIDEFLNALFQKLAEKNGEDN